MRVVWEDNVVYNEEANNANYLIVGKFERCPTAFILEPVVKGDGRRLE
jgi:hypothetical protein